MRSLRQICLILSPHVLIRLLLVGTSFFALFATIVDTILDPLPLDSYGYYLIAMLFLIALTSLGTWFEITKENISVNKDEMYRLLGAITLAGIGWWIYRKPFWLRFPMWFDEATQFIPFWRLIKPVSRTVYAAMQQQPPLPYYLSDFSLRTTGASYESAVYLSIIFGTLSLLVLALLLVQMRFSKLWMAVPIAIFCTQETLLRYTFEARPVSIAVFLALILLFFIFEGVKEGKLPFCSLFSSSFLLLHSTSLQPIFFIFFIVVCFIPFFWTKKKYHQICLLIFSVCAIPTILFLPNIYVIHKESFIKNQFYSSNHLLDFWNGIFKLDTHSFTRFNDAFNGLMPIVLLSLLLCFIGFAIAPSYSRKTCNELLKIFWACILFVFGFPILFRCFWTVIDWPLMPHYIALWTAGSVVLICFTLTQLRPSVSNFNKSIPIRIVTSIFCISSLAYIHYVYAPPQAERISAHRDSFHNWPTIMSFSAPEKKSFFVALPFNAPEALDFHGHYTGFLYSTNRQLVWSPSVHNIYNMSAYKISEDMRTFLNPEKISDFETNTDIYFIFNFKSGPPHEKESDVLNYLNGISSERVLLSNGREMFKIASTLPSSQTIRNVVLGLIERSPTSIWNGELLMLYIDGALTAGDLKTAAEMIRHLRKIDATGNGRAAFRMRLDSFEKQIKSD